MSETPEELEMEVRGLMWDRSQQVPIVLLRNEESKALLPIWIGPCEANAIALRLRGQEIARPMTHDLLQSSISQLGAEVKRILISDLKDDTFYARIYLHRNGEEVVVDSRPSDAIALAIRTDSPIFVRIQVLEKARAAEVSSGDAAEEGEDRDERLRKWLEELDPEDLGKYKM